MITLYHCLIRIETKRTSMSEHLPLFYIFTRLQQLADGLVDRFVVSGLMARDYDRVKLHITMLNTLMRKDPTGSTEPKRDHRGRPLRERERESFNAANILEVCIFSHCVRSVKRL